MSDMPPVTPILLRAREAARLLGIGERTLWSLSYPRGPVPVVRLPGTRAVRYSVAALEAFIAATQEGGQPGVEAGCLTERREKGGRP